MPIKWNFKFLSQFVLLSVLALVIMNVACSFITHGIASLAAAFYPGALYFVKTEKKLVALTIDDGPDSETTQEILAVLEQHGAKATFFLISSNVAGNEEVVAQIIQQGHELGNHMTHDEPTIKLTKSEFVDKFNKADCILSKFAKVRWFRPGSGWYSSEMIDYLVKDKRGYLCALGSVYPFDANISSLSFAVAFISLNVKPGAIIILHDRGKRGKRTVETLKRVLPKLKRRGYKIVTLTELYQTKL